MHKLEIIGAHVLFFTIFFLVFVNTGFAFGIYINKLSLPISYLVYLICLMGFKIKKHEMPKISGIAIIILLPLLFILTSKYFGNTLDASYDGQSYHQSAVIALANNWNPWKESTLPINIPEGKSFVIGYPKALWIIQSSIYTLLPEHINSSTSTNLAAMILAFIFVYGLLHRLWISKTWCFIISTFTVLSPAFVQEFFTFMADGFSYEIALISITSLMVVFIQKNNKLHVAIFFSSIILLTATKFSNLYVVGILVVIFLIYLLNASRRITTNIKLFSIFFISALIILWSPYALNLIHHESPFYPSNLEWAQNDLIYQNTPSNLKKSSKVVLFFYGIYSKTQLPSNANSKDNLAILKIPFTTSTDEINITNNYQGRVGSEGVLFSGIFSLSIAIFLLLLIKKRSAIENKKIICFSLSLLLIIGTAILANPIPNKLRYFPEFYLIPISILTILVLNPKQTFFIKGCKILLILLIAINIVIKIIPSSIGILKETKIAKDEMSQMKNSKVVYQVNAKSFYSNYVRLKEYGVIFKETGAVECKNPGHLFLSSFTTFYCPRLE